MNHSKLSQFNFVWLFAILAGGAILVLAVYGAIRIGSTLKYTSDTELAKKLSILTDPMEAGSASGKATPLSFNKKTEIRNTCLSGDFGESRISISTESTSSITATGSDSIMPNKYIFSEETENSKDFYIYSLPLEFPYKVSDMIILVDKSKKYCFKGDIPFEIENKLQNSGLDNLEFSACSGDSIIVCFGSEPDCDIEIQDLCTSNCDDYEEGKLEKDGDYFYYTGNLLYAAIFSDYNIYECNVERLLYRTGRIAGIYSKQADLLNARGCTTRLKSHLNIFSSSIQDKSHTDLLSLYQQAKEIGEINNNELCSIW